MPIIVLNQSLNEPLTQGTSIAAWPTDKCFPKAGDDFQVMFPILDLRVKDWTDQGILPYVSIEMA
jgi:hypothetical protein